MGEVAKKYARKKKKNTIAIVKASALVCFFFLVCFYRGGWGLKKTWDSSDIQQKNLCERDP
jgi:hypothetical protein